MDGDWRHVRSRDAMECSGQRSTGDDAWFGVSKNGKRNCPMQ